MKLTKSGNLLILGFFSVILPEQIQSSKSRPGFVPYKSWNTKTYPVWHRGDPRYKSSWTGGEVKFHVRNDAPTLTGAKITFSIDIVLPQNQVVLPDGLVVWQKNCFINGTQHREGEPVYPQEPMDEQDAVFPDGSSIGKTGDERPPYVFVWRTCGKYWQVADGPSSSLTIGSDDIPLGSNIMDVVIYHYRKREKFIPIGNTSTQFSITDQIPFAVTLSQVNDKDEGDQQFLQNRAIAFIIALHDPSGYLSSSDLTYSWDFGDGSGVFISRELTVTHTYTKTGFFKPHVVVQAAIPDPSCSTPSVTHPSADFLSEKPVGRVQLISAGTVMDLDAVTDRSNVEDHTTVEEEKMKKVIPEQDCVIYRYGSFSTGINIIEGIERVQIIQVADAHLAEQNAVDFTVTYQGSLPTEVCTTVSSADCLSPGKTSCTAVTPSPDFQLVLRRFFDHSGTFCIKVSLTNEVSLAVASSRVNVTLGSRFTIVDVVVMVLES